jgi:endonuclease/exonuclease/phosphatase family metal-dependent hydrolase
VVDGRLSAALQADGCETFAPIVVNRPARPLAGPLKVVAFNARGCEDPAAVAARLSQPPLAGAAIILASEMDWGLRRSGGRRTVADLAELLSMSFAFSPEFAFGRDPDNFRSFFGNAILSAAPLESVQVVPLPLLYDWTKKRLWGTTPGTLRVGRRGGVTARTELAGRVLTPALLHLENRASPAGRAGQMRQFLGSLPAAGPTIIGGDLNTTTVDLLDWGDCARTLARLALEPRRLRRPQPYEPLFEILNQAGFKYDDANQPLESTFTLTTLIPPFMRPKLDWIALRELRALPGSARVVRASNGWLKRISDHDFIVCDFEV